MVNALALDPTGATTLYVGLMFGSVWQSTPPPSKLAGFSGFVPIVLDVVGLAHYTSELQLTNLGASSTTVKLSYTGSIGSGVGGRAGDRSCRPAGRLPRRHLVSQIQGRSHPGFGKPGRHAPRLRSRRGRPRDGPDERRYGGSPAGRAAPAWPTPTAIRPSSSATKLYVYGLRTNNADRSNLAVCTT